MTSIIHNIDAGVSPDMLMKIDQWVRFGVAAVMLVACITRSAFSDEPPTTTDHKQQVVELLKSIETGDSKPLAYINPDKYIQHNLAVGVGLAGVMTLFQSLPKGSTAVNTVRVFQRRRFRFCSY